jgi:hypothetical protein
VREIPTHKRVPSVSLLHTQTPLGRPPLRLGRWPWVLRWHRGHGQASAHTRQEDQLTNCTMHADRCVLALGLVPAAVAVNL